jgi:hypothetical protein
VQVSIDKVVGDGITINFWHDRWLLQTILGSAYPFLYAIVKEQNIEVFFVLHTSTLQFIFTQTQTGLCLVEWQLLNLNSQHFSLDPLSRDSIKWRWTLNGIFTIHFIYDWL